MAAERTGTLPVHSEQDIVLCRQKIRVLAQELKLSLVDQTKLVTAVSELTRNTLRHGGGGEMRWEVVQSGIRTGVKIDFDDKGPGIADMKLAMSDGWTSGGGMGLGLPGSKRLVNDFDIRSAPGEGTCVSITKWK